MNVAMALAQSNSPRDYIYHHRFHHLTLSLLHLHIPLNEILLLKQKPSSLSVDIDKPLLQQGATDSRWWKQEHDMEK
jgi:hypothetical protein